MARPADKTTLVTGGVRGIRRAIVAGEERNPMHQVSHRFVQSNARHRRTAATQTGDTW